MMKNSKFWILLFLLVLLLALPLALRSPVPAGDGDSGDTLVIISAHNKSVIDEYTGAFSRYYRKKYGRNLMVDFRSVGGTSDIVRYIADRYEAEFRKYYEKTSPVGRWDSFLAASFADPASDKPQVDMRAKTVRRMFLESNTGIGIDLMAGGGVFDQQRQAERGYAVDAGVQTRHPEYFSDSVIPASFGGSPLYDPQGRYYSVVLSTFGIYCNLDRINEISGGQLPQRWHDLAEPHFFGRLSSADPSKSGSVTKCFEIMIQQCMHETGDPAKGWQRGFELIKRIFANSRSVGDSAGSIVRDVSAGESAAGIAIDTYALSEISYQKKVAGKARCAYVTPRGGTAVSGDPVQLLRGAPNEKIAREFIDFLLSEQGQRLHCFMPGTPDGPEFYALNRPPVRRDLYDEKYRKYSFDGSYDPYKSGADFVYRPELTGRYYGLIRQMIKVMFIDCHQELVAAWRAILAAGGPEKVPLAMQYFNRMPFDYADAACMAAGIRTGGSRTAVDVAKLLRLWSDEARKNFRAAEMYAKRGE